MLKHADIWAAIDRLAQDNGLSPSGLARRAGLDPTTFNRSKRITHQGRRRWPSTESIAKILAATGTSLAQFVGFVNGNDIENERHTVPLASLNDLRNGIRFSPSGYTSGQQWDEIAAPAVTDPLAFAVEMCGADFEPVFRDGDILIVSPSAPPRRGDRVMIHTHDGIVQIGLLQRQTAKRIDIQTFDRNSQNSFVLDDVAYVARILWASQ